MRPSGLEFVRLNDTENRQTEWKKLYMNRIKRGLWIIGLLICVCVLIFSAYSIYEYLSEAGQKGQEFAELAEIVEDTQNTKSKDEKEMEEHQSRRDMRMVCCQNI